MSREIKSFDLKINGHQVDMTFPHPDETQITKLKNAIKEEQMSATGIRSNYALSRFNINDVRIQHAYNALKEATSASPSGTPLDVPKGLSSAAIAASRFFTRKLVEGGKRRKNIKYKTKKMKYKKYKKNKNRKTIVKMK